jgi:hypothetical protein
MKLQLLYCAALRSDDLEIGGSRIDLLRFFALIDRAPGTFPIVTR